MGTVIKPNQDLNIIEINNNCYDNRLIKTNIMHDIIENIIWQRYKLYLYYSIKPYYIFMVK
jgi:hypothetical protein